MTRAWRATLATAVASVAISAPAPAASAAIHCVAVVDDPNNECAADHATVGNAVSAAAPGDTIRIGPGSRGGPGSPVQKLLHFEGAGAGSLDGFDPAVHTRLFGTAGEPGLELFDGGSVRSLQVKGGPNTGAEGQHAISLQLSEGDQFRVDDVVAEGSVTGNAELGPGGSGLFFISTDSATIEANRSTFVAAEQHGRAVSGLLQNGALTVRDSMLRPAANQGMGLALSGGATATLLTSSVIAPAAANNATGVARADPGLTRVVRSRIHVAEGVRVFGENGPGEVRVEVLDSLIEGRGTASVFAGPANGPARLLLRGTTLVSNEPFGAPVEANRPTPAFGPAIAELRNTIAHAPGDQPNPALNAVGGTILADFSAFATSAATNGGSAPAPGSGSNFNGVPPLNPDFSLPPGSPLADRGDPAVVAPGQLDLAGNPRSVDSNGDCTPAPDIGAFELTGAAAPCPPGLNAAPSIIGFRITNKVFAPLPLGGRAQVKRGTRFRYTLSEPAAIAITIERALAGRRVGRRCRKPTRRNRSRRRCIRFKRAGVLRTRKPAGRQTTPFSGRFRRRALRRGRYRARVRATDALGARSAERRLSFRVVRAPRRRR